MTQNLLNSPQFAPLLAAQQSILRLGQGLHRWIIGFSGGVDSRVLLDLLVQLRDNGYNSQDIPELVAIHVNHHIRGKHAVADAVLCEKICAEVAVSCQVVNINLPALALDSGKGQEEAARIERQRIFQQFAPAGCGVFLAHHANDQAETILMHLVRGCGLDGLVGMTEAQLVYPQLLLLRPLLLVGKSLLIDYARKRQLVWCEDHTNSDTTMFRNFLRQDIIPALESRNPQLVRQLVKLGQQVKEERLALESVAKEIFPTWQIESDGVYFTEVAEWYSYPELAVRYFRAATKVWQPQLSVTLAKWSTALKRYKNCRNGGIIPVTKNCQLRKYKGGAYLSLT